jgi:hypothetical protein
MYIYISLSMWKAKKIKIKVTSLPRGSVGKGPFAECSWQLLSATLGINFPSSSVPSFAERSCQGRLGTKVFLKNHLCWRSADHNSRHRIFFKTMENYLCRRPTAGSRHEFSKKYKRTPLCWRPVCEALFKEDFKNRQVKPPLTATFFRPTAHCRLSAKAVPRA